MDDVVEMICGSFPTHRKDPLGPLGECVSTTRGGGWLRSQRLLTATLESAGSHDVHSGVHRA
jgi:hypothetical protein